MANNDLVYSIVARANPAIKGLNKIADALDKVANSGANVKKALDGAIPANISVETKKTGESIRQAGDHAKKASGKIGMLLASLKRVAFYRAIRTALKEITQAFQEGTTNLYYYSQALGNIDSAHAVGTMNEFATTALYVKNSLGAALMPILQSLVPVVNAIADAFVWAANAVNQFFHALKGETVFTKAKRYAVDYAEALGGASGAAKELKKQIFGFDELNIFNSPSNGGGGGGTGLDYASMFDEAAISDKFMKIKEIINRYLGEDFLGRFKLNVKDILFDWKGLNKEQIAKKVVVGLNTLTGGVIGWILGGAKGAITGSILGATIGTYISTLLFNDDGKLSEDEIKGMLRNVLNIITGGVIGWTLGGPGGALMGMVAGVGLTALFETFDANPKGAMDSQEVGELLRIAAMGITGGVIGWTVGGPGGAFLGASVGVGLTALIQDFLPSAAMKLDEAAFIGLLASEIIAIVNPKGTLFKPNMETLGIIAVAAVTLSIASILTDEGFSSSQEKFAALLAESIGIIVGGIAGASLLAFAPLAGGLIGITIGATLTLVITKIFKNYTPESKRQLDEIGQGVDLKGMYDYLGSPDSSKTYVPKAIRDAEGRASGGYVSAGTYFYAGEAGPELIGTVGGKTNVTNQDQFTAGMEGIMDNTNTVILQAAQFIVNEIQRKDMTPVIAIGDRDIVRAYDRGKTLAGGSLVK